MSSGIPDLVSTTRRAGDGARRLALARWGMWIEGTDVRAHPRRPAGDSWLLVPHAGDEPVMVALPGSDVRRAVWAGARHRLPGRDAGTVHMRDSSAAGAIVSFFERFLGENNTKEEREYAKLNTMYLFHR